MPRKKRYAKLACRNCKAILPGNVDKCPYCGSRDLSPEFLGFVAIIFPDKSELAKNKNLREGFWAIKVL